MISKITRKSVERTFENNNHLWINNQLRLKKNKTKTSKTKKRSAQYQTNFLHNASTDICSLINFLKSQERIDKFKSKAAWYVIIVLPPSGDDHPDRFCTSRLTLPLAVTSTFSAIVWSVCLIEKISWKVYEPCTLSANGSLDFGRNTKEVLFTTARKAKMINKLLVRGKVMFYHQIMKNGNCNM